MSNRLKSSDKIVLFGGAGLVGQNLVVLLKERGYGQLTVVDKHRSNLEILRGLHPDIEAIEADMAEPGSWQDTARDAAAAIMLQAQIGGEYVDEFTRNNVTATELALEAMRRYGVTYLVHISSSVVNSMARDFYTESKKAQEKIVHAQNIAHCVLRPTLMFGWFDRKHLGWLSRFMQKVPVFPVPGSGRYVRQPLYVRDFCNIIVSCLEQKTVGIYDITGAEKIDYIDIIGEIKRVTRAKTRILKIPYWSFWLLLKLYAVFSRQPPFTTQQLRALVTPDEFLMIPWWELFQVRATPFTEAVQETYGQSRYQDVVLDF